MLLSELVGKNVYSGRALRGVCRGVCLSLKTRAVKYLLCGSASDRGNASEFSVSVASIREIGENICLKRLRAASAGNCVRFYMGRPVYSEDGIYLGDTSDLDMEDFTAMKLVTNTGKTYTAAAIAASGDAVILRKEPLFPVGSRVPERVPAGEGEIAAGTIVTRGVLKRAISAGSLIALTRSVLPLPSIVPFLLREEEEENAASDRRIG